jgi:hypothetical protein
MSDCPVCAAAANRMLPPLSIQPSLSSQALIQAIKYEAANLSQPELIDRLVQAVTLAEARQAVIRSLLGGLGGPNG